MSWHHCTIRIMAFSENEKNGIRDLFLENTSTLIQLAKSLIKNVTTITTREEALLVLFIHGTDAHTLLSKKVITKELLFKYLNKHHVSLELNITKPLLIAKTLQYWSKTSPNATNDCDENLLTEKAPSPNVIANAFADWFFGKYNADDLHEIDLWPDANLNLRIMADDAMEESSCQCAKDVVTLLMEKKLQFGFYFNLNSSKTGVQGRMDVHGMLLVLTCGTLHTKQTCVGVFEWLFGLLRDPYECNNWKIKTLRCLLRSQQSTKMPTLEESESLKDALTNSEDTEDYG